MKLLIRTISILATLLLGWPALAATNAQAQQSNCQTFAQTGQTVCGAFLQYWNNHGGLAQQGYPISGQFPEVSEVDGKTYTVQYFERAVFEMHLENKPPYDVLLSLLGAKQLKTKYPQGAPDNDPSVMTGETQLFPETGKHVTGIFLDYWRNNGGLAQQGYPLTNPFLESITRTTPPYVVQYFERAVFELHSDASGNPLVLLSRLGATEFANKYPSGQPFPTATPGGDAWAALRARPLVLPTVPAGSACPITPGQVVSPDYGPALGPGPVYPVGFGAEGVAHLTGANQEGGWLYVKVLWIVDPAYKGPALVRGHQIDGPDEMGFDRGPNPSPELQLDQQNALSGGGQWPNWPTYTRIKGSGCYAYQIDGTNFSKVVVFSAVP
jgi:hypothetical protein